MGSCSLSVSWSRLAPRGSQGGCLLALALLLLVASSPPSAAAEALLEYLPEDALGFVMFHDLSTTSQRAQMLASTLGAPLPAPLEYLKFSTGITAGLDESGDALVAMIPGSRANDPPMPMVLLPVSNYARFANALQGDESGASSRVKVAGEDVLIAKQGPYALMMNLEHRETLELMLGLEAAPVKQLAPWEEWFTENNVAVVVMPSGMRWLLSRGLKELTEEMSRMRNDPLIAGAAGQLQQAEGIYRVVFALVSTEIELAGVGVAVDDNGNITLGKRLMLKSDLSGELASDTDTTNGSTTNPLVSYADVPFVLAGGCRMPSATLEKMVTFCTRVMRASPQLWGLRDLPGSQWQSLQAAVLESVEQIRSMSLCVLPGEEDDPVMSNVYSVLRVDDPQEFLADYKNSVEVWNEMLQQSQSDIQLQYELEDLEIAGLQAVRQEVDVAAAAEDPAVPQFNWVLESMFGEDGKLRITLVAVDDHHVLFGMNGQADMELAIERLRQGELGLEQSSHVQETTKLMPAEVAGRFYISPQGLAEWTQRMIDSFVPIAGGMEIPQLKLPETPPIGISVQAPKKQLAVDIVWPANVTKKLVEHFGEQK